MLPETYCNNTVKSNKSNILYLKSKVNSIFLKMKQHFIWFRKMLPETCRNNKVESVKQFLIDFLL